MEHDKILFSIISEEMKTKMDTILKVHIWLIEIYNVIHTFFHNYSLSYIRVFYVIKINNIAELLFI